MKNKEIEELLNELKEVTNSKKLSSTYCITNKHWQLLLSHIEQLEKELKEEQEDNYKQSQLLVEKQQKIEQLEKNRDKAVEYVKEFRFATVKFEQHSDTLLNILKGGSDE